MSTRVSPRAELDFKTKIDAVTADDADWFTDIDTLNARGVLIVGQAGPFAYSGTNKITLTLQDSDDGTAYADVKSDMVDGAMKANGELIELKTAITAANAVFGRWAYLGKKRYLQVGVKDKGGTVSGEICVTVVLNHLRIAPVDRPS